MACALAACFAGSTAMLLPLSDFIPAVPWHARHASSFLGGGGFFVFAAARVGASTHASAKSKPLSKSMRRCPFARLELIRHYLRAKLAHELSLLQAKIGEYLGIFLLYRQQVVAGGAIVGNGLAVGAGVRAVVTAEAARKIV